MTSAARALATGRALLWRMVAERRGDRVGPLATLRQGATGRASVVTSATPCAAATTTAAAAAAAADPSHHDHHDRPKTLDPREARKFGALADQWWDVDSGPFAPLHSMNPVRVAFIRDAVLETRRRQRQREEKERAGAAATSTAASKASTSTSPSEASGAAQQPREAPSAAEPLAGLRVLDVGCGGGILSEPLARLGAAVIGVDAAREGVRAARRHAALDPRVKARTTYRAATAERLLAELTGVAAAAAAKDGDGDDDENNDDDNDDAPCCRESFDVVVASEVIEHVRDPASFLATLAALTKPRTGQVVVSTLNRTPAALALAVVGAERVAGIVPAGTHDWARFLTPQELAMLAADCGLEVAVLAGMVPDLRAGAGAVVSAAAGGGGNGGGLAGALLSKWRLSASDVRINYIALLQHKQS
jgi:2-polyprenyl-6-hydroxyphenyl methylase / 3-demethylubiquinone-9 3-methyltransferase